MQLIGRWQCAVCKVCKVHCLPPADRKFADRRHAVRQVAGRQPPYLRKSHNLYNITDVMSTTVADEYIYTGELY